MEEQCDNFEGDGIVGRLTMRRVTLDLPKLVNLPLQALPLAPGLLEFGILVPFGIAGDLLALSDLLLVEVDLLSKEGVQGLDLELNTRVPWRVQVGGLGVVAIIIIKKKRKEQPLVLRRHHRRDNKLTRCSTHQLQSQSPRPSQKEARPSCTS